ncbi:MAG TPA: protein kinase [Actinomycetota bacterium]|jgi:serine/threonine-protein kinase|nr:protein kinase [Actinomycetota bacterium]
MPDKTLADRYELLDRVGSGGMGTVWRAHDRVLGRDVAVKLLHEGLAADATFAERFRHEALAAAKLTHPHIVAVFDTGEQDGVPFIVMELVSGPSLHSVLTDHGALPVAEVARIGLAVSGALAHAHGRGLIHRDMKPANVLLDEETNEPKVADFGIAKGLEDSGGLTRTGGLIGTAAYLSPEQVSGKPATPASDVYAVGCLLYACLTGEAPFGGETPVAIAMQHINEPVVPIQSRRPDVPDALAKVVHRALEKEPGRRYAGAGDMQRALARTGLGAGPPTDLSAAPTVQVVGTAAVPARTHTQRIDRPRRARPKPPPSTAGRILAVLSAVLIVTAAAWLTAMYLQGRSPQVQGPLPTFAPSLEPSTPEPSPSPSPSPPPTESPSNDFPLDLPGFGNN